MPVTHGQFEPSALSAAIRSITGMPTPVNPIDEPPHSLTDPRRMLDAYLDYFRHVVPHKLDGLPERELRTSRLSPPVGRRWSCSTI